MVRNMWGTHLWNTTRAQQELIIEQQKIGVSWDKLIFLFSQFSEESGVMEPEGTVFKEYFRTPQFPFYSFGNDHRSLKFQTSRDDDPLMIPLILFYPPTRLDDKVSNKENHHF